MVAISFDSTHWSKEHFAFTYRKKFDTMRFTIIAGGYAAAALLFGGFIWKILHGKRGGNGEEQIPFIGQAAVRRGIEKRKGTRKRVEV
jgi:hypothetical protein